MSNLIIGTAGHIDHGKSTLIRALTGIDPAHLPEEKERGMTIDLGYAHLTLPDGQEIGIVDVPGHERFVKNMLAGATGIDFALLVIAADDGVMPQTKEHFQILNLLEVKHGFVVINKVDLVDDETVELVKDEIQDLVEGSGLENASIFCVSGTTGEGIDALRESLSEELMGYQKESQRVFFRLPVDRSFAVEGFGCVVTGTVTGGRVSIGEEIEVLPQGALAKIRGIQVHNKEAESAEEGQRAALNLSGIKKNEIQRGCQIAAVGHLRSSTFLTGEFFLLPETRNPLKNFSKVRLHIGTVETVARIVFLDRSSKLKPSESTFVQFRLETPVVADRQDRFVVREMSPQRTLGGGRILLVGAEKISRFQPAMLHYLKVLAQGTPLEQLEAEIRRPRTQLLTLGELAIELGLSPLDTQEKIDQLGDKCITFQDGRTEKLIHRQVIEEMIQWIEETLESFHKNHPILLGMTRNELKRKLSDSYQELIINLAIEQAIQANRLTKTKQCIHRVGWKPILDKPADSIRSGMLAKLRESPYETPRRSDLIEYFEPYEISEEVFNLMLQTHEIVKVSNEVIFLGETFEQAKKSIKEYITKQGEIKVSDLRDQLGTSRKYTLPLLEHLDSIGFTQRIGDKRILKK